MLTATVLTTKPTVTIYRWWSNSHLSGTNTVLCGYYENDDDESFIHRLVSFDIKHVKPRRVQDMSFDDEICTGSLCTFVQFIKDITFDGKIQSFTLRFEPGSKRMCILEAVHNLNSTAPPPSFETQLSAADETSSVEATPRTPRFDETEQNGFVSDGTMPRLRKFNRQDSSRPQVKRRNTMTQEMGMKDHEVTDAILDNDDNKYGTKKKKKPEEEDPDWVHLVIIVVFMLFGFFGIPQLIALTGNTSPY